jgi:hypothetical protein
MRTPLLSTLFALAIASGAMAQCCCSQKTFEVVLAGPARTADRWNYTVQDEEGSFLSLMPTDDIRTFTVVVHTGCGHVEEELRIVRPSTGRTMRLRFTVNEGDSDRGPTIRVPFTPGHYTLDLDRLISCMPSLDIRTEAAQVDTVDCGGERLISHRSVRHEVLEVEFSR